MGLITLIRNQKQIAGTLQPKSILMNNLSEDIIYGKGNVLIDRFTGRRIASSLSDLREFATHCSCIGALLSYDGSKYTIWNGDPDADDYWDPTVTGTLVEPSTKYGTVIAACTGNGLWTIRNWNGVSNSHIWAESGSDLYSSLCQSCIKGSGWENTYHVMLKHGSDVVNYTSTIWYQLTQTQIDGIRPWHITSEHGALVQIGDLYIPNSQELREICYNVSDPYPDQDIVEGSKLFQYKNALAKLLGLSNDGFWSSSQCPVTYDNAFFVGFNGGYVYFSDKGSSYLSLACLHF